MPDHIDPLSVDNLREAYIACVERTERNLAEARKLYPDKQADMFLKEAEVSAELAKAHATMMQAVFLKPVLTESMRRFQP